VHRHDEQGLGDVRYSTKDLVAGGDGDALSVIFSLDPLVEGDDNKPDENDAVHNQSEVKVELLGARCEQRRSFKGVSFHYRGGNLAKIRLFNSHLHVSKVLRLDVVGGVCQVECACAFVPEVLCPRSEFNLLHYST